MTRAVVSVGVAGALGPTAIARIAEVAEACGLSALWINDTPDGDSLVAAAAAAAATTRLRLGTGVIPVDRRSAADIAAASAGLPANRVVLGIGSGQTPRPVLPVMREAVRSLRAHTAPGTRVMVGGLGPKMRALAASQSDGVLLNWLTPDAGHAQSVQAHAVAAGTHVALYVRTALEDAAVPRLEAESARYASYPSYAANFTRLGVSASDTVLRPGTAEAALPRYRDAVDEIVLRAITATDDVDDYLRFVEGVGRLLA